MHHFQNRPDVVGDRPIGFFSPLFNLIKEAGFDGDLNKRFDRFFWLLHKVAVLLVAFHYS